MSWPQTTADKQIDDSAHEYLVTILCYDHSGGMMFEIATVPEDLLLQSTVQEFFLVPEVLE